MEETFYLTKYALTNGVEEICGRCDGKYVPYASGYMVSFFLLGRDIFRNREDAVRQAEAMRMKKIASLKKTLAKLEKMTF